MLKAIQHLNSKLRTSYILLVDYHVNNCENIFSVPQLRNALGCQSITRTKPENPAVPLIINLNVMKQNFL